MTAVPTVPVAGQLIVTANGAAPETVIPILLDVSWIFDIVPSAPTPKAENGFPVGLVAM